MMRKMFPLLRCAALVSLCLGAVVSSAQSGANADPAEIHDPVPASRFDTRSMIVQVDTSQSRRPFQPRNPAELPDFAYRHNDLPVGSVAPLDRFQAQALWPAISNTGWYPPDPDIAVGPNHVVAVVNSSIAFFTKSGTKQFQRTALDFFSGMGAGTFIFDPKCFYDRVRGRYVIVFLEQSNSTETSKLLLAVSDDSDPNGTWYRYRLESKLIVNGVAYWLDYPGFGYNKDAYVVSGNMFGFGSGFVGAQFITIPSAPASNGQPVSTVSIHHSNSTSVQMAEVIDPARNVVFGVSRNGTTSMRLHAIRNPGTGTPTHVFTNVSVPSNSSPSSNAPSTSGRFLSTIDGRVFNAVWRGGRMVAAHTISLSGINTCRWYEFNTNSWPESGSPSLVQSGNIGSTSLHYFTPAININGAGSISALMTASSTTVTADIRIASRVLGDPAGVMATPSVLESSVGINYTLTRWGDYFGVDVDPVDDSTFYGIGMSVAADNNWRTSIFSWSVGSPGNTAPQVTILLPTDGATFSLGTSVQFSGSAVDAQQGDMSSQIAWTSSLQGAIGTGAMFETSQLVAGAHVITASVTDAGNLTGSASARITVLDPNVPPNAPSNLAVAQASAGNARLTWTDNASNEDSFEVERQTKVGKGWSNTVVFTVPANTTSTTDSAGSGTFRYRIRARNRSGASAWTSYVQVKL
jgi:hypothetical protein